MGNVFSCVSGSSAASKPTDISRPFCKLSKEEHPPHPHPPSPPPPPVTAGECVGREAPPLPDKTPLIAVESGTDVTPEGVMTSWPRADVTPVATGPKETDRGEIIFRFISSLVGSIYLCVCLSVCVSVCVSVCLCAHFHLYSSFSLLPCIFECVCVSVCQLSA